MSRNQKAFLPGLFLVFKYSFIYYNTMELSPKRGHVRYTYPVKFHVTYLSAKFTKTIMGGMFVEYHLFLRKARDISLFLNWGIILKFL